VARSDQRMCLDAGASGAFRFRQKKQPGEGRAEFSSDTKRGSIRWYRHIAPDCGEAWTVAQQGISGAGLMQFILEALRPWLPQGGSPAH
jgi:hypothetical protein